MHARREQFHWNLKAILAANHYRIVVSQVSSETGKSMKNMVTLSTESLEGERNSWLLELQGFKIKEAFPDMLILS